MLPCRNGGHPFLVYTQRSYRRITEVKDEKEVVCSGKTTAPFIMGVMFWLIGIGVTFLLLILGTSKEVKGAGIIFFILCGMEGSYFLLFWRNKRITMTRDDIIYRSIWGKEKKYSWEDVRSVRYKSAGRGAYRILIQTDRKICIETGMMKNSEEAEKLIKEKGYLGLH